MLVNKLFDVESLTVYTRTNAPDLKPLSKRFSYIHCEQAEWCQSLVTYQTFLREQSEREERVWLICAGCSSQHGGMLYVCIMSCDAACTTQGFCNLSSCPSLVTNIHQSTSLHTLAMVWDHFYPPKNYKPPPWGFLIGAVYELLMWG